LDGDNYSGGGIALPGAESAYSLKMILSRAREMPMPKAAATNASQRRIAPVPKTAIILGSNRPALL
jgi:hypothetical protein